MLTRLYNFFRYELFNWTHLHIKKGMLVLDIGSGNNPSARADVLCDSKIFDSSQRAGQLSVVIDGRPFVYADVRKGLPFKDKIFDFVICSHILEHIDYPPTKVINEIMRVGKAGYIESPSILAEKLQGWDFHKILIEKCEKDGEVFILIIPKKNCRPYGILPKSIIKSKSWAKVINENKEHFITSYIWNNEIKYRLLEQSGIQTQKEDEADDTTTQEIFTQLPQIKFRRILKWQITKFFRHIWGARNNINMQEILICPECKSEFPNMEQNYLFCHTCNKKYPIFNSLGRFYKFL